MQKRLAGFRQQKIDVGEAVINTFVCGTGDPILMLHGYPQTHLMWHKVAPTLAKKYTVVLTDLRGYGDSSCPEPDLGHTAYSKRKMAKDQIKVMEKLGYDRFLLVGHDRGARVSHQLLLDYPEKVKRALFLDIIATIDMFTHMDVEMVKQYYHWFFLIQEHGLPEALIEGAPEKVVRSFIQRLSNKDDVFPDDVMQQYIEKFSNTSVIHATCEDYRAGATCDLEHIASSGLIECPLCVLWGAPGLRRFDVLELWRKRAKKVSGFLVEESGHYIAEEAPETTIRTIEDFFASDADMLTDAQIAAIKKG